MWGRTCWGFLNAEAAVSENSSCNYYRRHDEKSSQNSCQHVALGRKMCQDGPRTTGSAKVQKAKQCHWNAPNKLRKCQTQAAYENAVPVAEPLRMLKWVGRDGSKLRHALMNVVVTLSMLWSYPDLYTRP